MKCPVENCNAELLRVEILDEQREEDRQGEVLTEYIILKCPKCKRKFDVTAIYRVSYELVDSYFGDDSIEETEESEPEISNVKEADLGDGRLGINFDEETDNE